jgi:hypothetical protein
MRPAGSATMPIPTILTIAAMTLPAMVTGVTSP